MNLIFLRDGFRIVTFNTKGILLFEVYVKVRTQINHENQWANHRNRILHGTYMLT